MGYAQELKRGMGWFSNFAISFSIISILAGGMTAYWLGMVTGGPMVITLGWIIVGFFALLVGMAMGEICSAYPTAGGLYYWSAKLARKNGPRWSWFTGWFNLLGQIGVIASVDYTLAVFIAYFIRMFDDGYRLTVLGIFGIFVLVLIAHGLLNTFGVSVIRLLGDISVWWHVVGVVIIFFILMIAPTNTRGLSSVFDQAPPGLTGWTGGASISVYLFALGLLLAQYTITGFDASAHVSEETVGARTEAPKAIVRSIYVSAIAAFFLNLAMTQAIPNDPDAYGAIAFGDANDPFLVNAAPRLISTAVGLGTAKFIIFIAIVAQFFCGMASVTANSRMIYAFSRDGALPGSKYWHKINPKTRTPTNSIWLGVVLSAIVGCDVAVRPGYGCREVLDSVLRDDRYLRDRPVHRLRDPDLPAPHQPRLPARPVEPEGPPQDGGVDGDRLDRLHHAAVLRAAVLAVLAAMGRRQPDSRRWWPERRSTSRTTSTSPRRSSSAACWRSGCTGTSPAASGSPARRSRGRPRSCWRSSASSTPSNTAPSEADLSLSGGQARMR